MKIKLFMLIMAVSVMAGCATTTITMPGSGSIVIKSKSDALVTYKKDEKGAEEVIVDNRGRPSVFESLLGLAITRTNAEVE